MGWKEWPYWLRGGLIFLVISIILTLVFYSIGAFEGEGWGAIPLIFPIAFIFLPFVIIGIPAMIAAPLSYLILGVFFGWLYGKRKEAGFVKILNIVIIIFAVSLIIYSIFK